MKPKKSLGQNWLTSTSARAAIIEAAQITEGETILEVGPGKGFLTEALLQAGAKVVAVEKDDRLIEFLEEKFETEIGTGKLELVHQDILDFSPDSRQLKAGNWKLVANIPYYITGEILRQFLAGENQPTQMVLLVQKEVAERMVAKDGKQSLMSIGVASTGRAKYLKTVPRGAFAPVPRVDSAIIVIDQISPTKVPPEQKQLFWQIVHQGFAHKRKQLKTNLACSTEVFAACTIDPTIRAEKLTLNDWLCLTKNWKNR